MQNKNEFKNRSFSNPPKKEADLIEKLSPQTTSEKLNQSQDSISFQAKEYRIQTMPKMRKKGGLAKIFLIIFLVLVILGLLGIGGFFIYRNRIKILAFFSGILPKKLAKEEQPKQEDLSSLTNKVENLEKEIEEIKKSLTGEELEKKLSEKFANLATKEEIKAFEYILKGQDMDKDGLSDYAELYIYGTKPDQADTDKDTYSDRTEVDHGYDPKVKEPGVLVMNEWEVILGKWEGTITSDVISSSDFKMDLSRDGLTSISFSFKHDEKDATSTSLGRYTFEPNKKEFNLEIPSSLILDGENYNYIFILLGTFDEASNKISGTFEIKELDLDWLVAKTGDFEIFLKEKAKKPQEKVIQSWQGSFSDKVITTSDVLIKLDSEKKATASLNFEYEKKEVKNMAVGTYSIDEKNNLFLDLVLSATYEGESFDYKMKLSGVYNERKDEISGIWKIGPEAPKDWLKEAEGTFICKMSERNENLSSFRSE